MDKQRKELGHEQVKKGQNARQKTYTDKKRVELGRNSKKRP